MIDISYALTVEGWKPIPGFPGYEVSRLGDARSFRAKNRWQAGTMRADPRPVILHQDKRWGYWHFGPRREDGTRVNLLIHQVVASTFIGECPDGHEVNHKDGNKAHNWVENLEYLNHSENMKHAWDAGLIASARGENHPRARLTEADILQIRAERERGDLLSVIAAKHGITFQTVSDIYRKKTWSHL